MSNAIIEQNHTAHNTLTGAAEDLELGVVGFTYADLYRPERLRDLAEAFYGELKRSDAALHERLMEYVRTRGAAFKGKAESELLIAAAPHLSRFIARLFRIEEERRAQIEAVRREDPVFAFKYFVARRATKNFPPEKVADLDPAALDRALAEFRRVAFPETLDDDEELAIARITVRLLEWEKELEQSGKQQVSVGVETAQAIRAARERVSSRAPAARDFMSRWRDGEADVDLGFVRSALKLIEAWVGAHAAKARARVRGWASFRSPHHFDYANLVPIERPRADLPELMRGLAEHLRRRDGFRLTDRRAGLRQVLDEVHYCLICHERDKDSCSKGMRERDGSTKRNPLGIELQGCPLDEKISEMHSLKREGDSIAALALVMIDNPMCPGTGHRICNDCMKSCIFQKQEPVNIPQVETGVLTDVLKLPYGFEIYSLLTRWNPLNAKRPYALPYNGKNVLIVGLGPAGYTLAQYLLNEGFGVVGIDGLKIEPLKPELIGDETKPPRPIRDLSEITTELDQRVLAGFGGVSEYGITVRWDKNFLTMIHLALARRRHFRFYGGIRFGGTLTIEDAWALGFDHIAIAAGAGRPTIIDMKNNLIRGIRKASDFLMALQLTGAFKRDSLANLQVRLPAVVIGGGLTAIDTATELAAYYPVQVEKMLDRHERLVAEFGEERVWAMFDEEERAIYREFLEHGRAVRRERERAAAAGERPDFVKLVRAWGGVSIVYRRRLQDSPAYRLNHEEVVKALEEGISFIENMNPVEAVPDRYGAVEALVFERVRLNPEKGKWEGSGELVRLPARTVCVAAGTSPNITYEKEHPGTFVLDERGAYFAPHKAVRDEEGNWHLVRAAKGEPAFFTSYEHGDKHFVTFYGDNHPTYAGNVVKAMASAKHGYEQVVALFADEIAALKPEEQTARELDFKRFIERLDEELIARVVRVERLTPTIVEVVVRAPMQARKFHPGQFYRLQNYEADAPEVEGTRLMMEGLALTGAWVDKERGLLSLIVLEMGASSRLCALLRPGQQVVVMGPTGAPTEIPAGETVMLVGGGLGNAVLFSIARALRENGCRVIYFAGYRRGEDLFKREEIEAATDQVIWATDAGREIEPHRPQDRHFRGNIVEAMLAYAEGRLGRQLFDLREVDRIIVIGSDGMMAAVKRARHTVLAPYLKGSHVAIGSINSPMQCMLKEICAQCLQRHVDPLTGEEKCFVFSCFNQDQKLDEVDFNNLSNRLRMNSVQEKQANLWLDLLFHRMRRAAVSD